MFRGDSCIYYNQFPYPAPVFKQKNTEYLKHTLSGLFARKLDPPVDIPALQCGDNIDVFLKADIAHIKALSSLNMTSKNLAALGIFIKWND